MSHDTWWRRIRSRLRPAASPITAVPAATNARGKVADSLRQLLDDATIPPAIREELASDFDRIRAMLARLDLDQLHIAVFGRVSTGKSALGNALLGREAFTVGVLHGTTMDAEQAELDEATQDGLVLIDTPGINELDGQSRERLAFDVADIADLVIFVADGDLTRDELDALRTLADTRRPMLLVLNKADRYSPDERASLLQHLRERTHGLLREEDVLAVAARPAPRRVIEVDHQGNESIRHVDVPPDVAALRERLLAIARHEGKTLAALNAGMHAGKLADQVALRMTQVRRELASRLIRHYCVAKGLAVALNPIPVADLLAAAGLDAAMVVQLSRLYGLPLTRAESGRLVAVISTQLVALMGAVWGMQLVASALKGLSGGLSMLVTAAAQGALAWYATVLIGRAAERYLAAGKSWGVAGPKRAVAEVVALLDRDSILREAREEILRRLRRGG